MIVCSDESYFIHQGNGESRMLPQVVEWMQSIRWVRSDSLVVREFPINGRRVDLAVMTKSGLLSSFELKLGGFSRVLEQASYNQLSFDRSWIVVGSIPRRENLKAAEHFGIGVIVCNGEAPEVLLRPGAPNVDADLRSRLQGRMLRIGDPGV